MTVRRCPKCHRELLEAEEDEQEQDSRLSGSNNNNNNSDSKANFYNGVKDFGKDDGKKDNNHEQNNNPQKSLLQRSIPYIGYAGAGVAVCAGTLTLAGFAPAGIVAGSMAALWQSSLGNVAAGSTFAILQSAGATGTIATAGVVGGGVTAVSAGTAYIVNQQHQNRSSTDGEDSSGNDGHEENVDNDDGDDDNNEQDFLQDLICPECGRHPPQ